MSPYTIERIDTIDVQRDRTYSVTRLRLIGPGIATKPFPADARERLDDIAAMLNAAYAAGVEHVARVVEEKLTGATK